MRNLKFGVFLVGLSLAVGGAVSAAGRSSTHEPPAAQEVRSLRAFGGSQLGISVSDSPNGVRVDRVHAGTPAEKAGMREGDLVVEFDGERVRSAMQLTRLVHETPEGRQVAVAVMRDGKRQTLQATPDLRDPGTGIREPEFFLRQLPHFNFEYDDRIPRRFEYRLPAPGSRFPGFRGQLGVTIQSLTPELEEYFGATNGGALVSSVARDSAAAKAGIKAGDVIVAIDGRQIGDSSDLMRELRALTGEITVQVLRDRKELTLKATLTDEAKWFPARII
jgi:serine protease Do